MIHRCPTSGLRVSGLWVSTPQANAKLADVSTWEYQDRTANISTRWVRERLRIVEVSLQSVYDVFTPSAVSTNSPCRHTLHWTSSTASQAEDTIRETYWIISAITQTGSEGVSTLVPPKRRPKQETIRRRNMSEVLMAEEWLCFLHSSCRTLWCARDHVVSVCPRG